MRNLLVGAILLGLVACDSAGGERGATPSPSVAESPTGEPTVTPSPSPTPPPRPDKPRPAFGRLDGTYLVRLTTISSNVETTNDNEQVEWTFNARCRGGGECDARVESETGWHRTAIWRSGKYRWSRANVDYFTCTIGSDTNAIEASLEYVITGTKVRWDGQNWIISSFSGTFQTRASSNCGFLGVPEERANILGRAA